MPTPTYVPLLSYTLPSNSTSVALTGIPQGYTDLVLQVTAYNTTASQEYRMYFNNDTTTVYNFYGVTASPGGGRSTFGNQATGFFRILPNSSIPNWNVDDSTFEININGYSSTAIKKCYYATGQATSYSIQHVGVWPSTAAITSIYFSTGGGNIAANSTFNIYGIIS